MRIDYSKPSIDIFKENESRILNDKKLFEEQMAISKLLLKCDDRKVCVVCNFPLNGDIFNHRGIPFILCCNCGHIQTKALPPIGYPENVKNGLSFEKIYPQLDATDYENRKNRIYKPKLNWVINCLEELGFNSEKLKQLKWMELGCGAGYFIAALKDFGAQNIKGIDADKNLIANGNEYLHHDLLQFFSESLDSGITQFDADIYVSFFVLEHIENSYKFFNTLKNLKSGTIFVFSVPVFGFSNLIENVFTNNYARNLDCVIHTQIFTEKSINYAMKLADFSIVAQWIFGQDSVDFIRILMSQMENKYPSSFYNPIKEKLINLVDLFQSSLDKINLSDQRHIIAMKN